MKTSQRRKVVVTGMGLVTALGPDRNSTWNGIMESHVPARKVKSFEIGDMPCQIAYEIDSFTLDARLASKIDVNETNRFTRFGLNAALEALDEAQLNHDDGISDLSIVLGTGMGSPSFDNYVEVWAKQKENIPELLETHRDRPEILSHLLKKATGAGRSVKTVHTACASSGQSLGEAYEMIACGEEDLILTGGADSMINPFHMAGFCLLGALSNRNDSPTTASRPFDEERNGFVLGEGAAMLVFESEESAIKRGAKIIGEVCGYGITESAYRITDLHPEGRGPIEAMSMAVSCAGIDAHKVAYVNAHGTSTLLNDRIESLAVQKVFGNSTRVSSTKSMTGHTISAAGALEFAVAMMAVEHQTLPPSVNVFQKDPQCPVQLTDSRPAQTDIPYALSNSVGFGGSNTALIAGRRA